MKSNEEIIEIALKVCNATMHDFLHTRRQNVSYARSIISKYLVDKGLKHEDIALLTNRNRSSISSQLTDFEDRLKYDKLLKKYYDAFLESVNK